MLEGDRALSLREQPLGLDAGAVRLLTGVLRHNGTLHELDLSATDLDADAVAAIGKALAHNQGLAHLRLSHLPSLDEAGKAALAEQMHASNPNLRVEF